jgi:uncharacterized protein
MRTLVIIIVLALIIMIARRLWQTPRPPARPGRQPGKMVQCANCGVYIPVQEALSRGEHFYCSQAHLNEDMDNKS